MKHLESFQNFKFDTINEEEGLLSTAMLAASLLFNNVEANPEKVGVQTEVVVQSPKLEANFLEASTSKSQCFNSALYKFGLTRKDSKFYTSTVGDFKSRIGKDSTKIFENFKPIQSNIKGQDVLKIGNVLLVDEGSQAFSLEDDSQIIVASANGLLALSRIARAGFDSVPYSMMKINFKSDRGAKSVSYDLKDKVDLTASCNSIFFSFQTSITPKNKFHATSIGFTSQSKLIGASEDFQVEYLTSFISGTIRKFIPKEIQEEAFKNVNFTKFDSTIVRDLLQEFKKTGVVDKNVLNAKLLPAYKKFYLENFKIFMTAYFPQEISSKLFDEYSKKVIFKIQTYNQNSWQASSFTTFTVSKPTIKGKEIKYAEGK